jgi:FkbM family methyltransferase
MPMFQSIGSQWRLSAAAPGTRNRALAFLLGIHAGLGEHRRWSRRLFHWLIGCFGEGDLVVCGFLINGCLLQLAMRKGDRADYLVGGEFIHGSYEPPRIAPSRIIDAGGNIGTFSLAAAARFPGVPITVYEPDDANFARLTDNLHMNGIDAKLVRKGVWSSDATLYFQKMDSYTGFVSCKPTSITVECVVPEVAADDWLKLDIEGAEYEVLPALFARGIFPYFISLELHHRREKGDGLIALARANGYRVSGPLDVDAECINVTLSRLGP